MSEGQPTIAEVIGKLIREFFRTLPQLFRGASGEVTGRHSDDHDLQDRLDKQMKRLKAEREAMPEVHDALTKAEAALGWRASHMLSFAQRIEGLAYMRGSGAQPSDWMLRRTSYTNLKAAQHNDAFMKRWRSDTFPNTDIIRPERRAGFDAWIAKECPEHALNPIYDKKGNNISQRPEWKAKNAALFKARFGQCHPR